MSLNIKQSLCIITCICATAITPVYAEDSEIPEKLKPFHTNFLAADADKSGGLDSVEFKALIDANASMNLGKAKMIQKRNAYDRAFSKFDADKDKLVTWSEIESMQR